MLSYPFNSEITGYAGNGLPQFDRAIDAETFRDWTKTFYTNGVRANSSDFLVAAGNGMNITVEPGKGNVEGVIFHEDKKRTLAVQTSESMDRIDTVVIRLDELQRTVDLYIVKGTAADRPQRPSLRRPVSNESGDYYELGIADIFVAKYTSSIEQHRITDTRLDTTRCGVIASAILELDTKHYYDQLQSALDTYLDTVQSAIDGTLAGNLQNQINKQGFVSSYQLTFTTNGSTSQTAVFNGNLTSDDYKVYLNFPSNLTLEQIQAIGESIPWITGVQYNYNTQVTVELKSGKLPKTSFSVQVVMEYVGQSK